MVSFSSSFLASEIEQSAESIAVAKSGAGVQDSVLEAVGPENLPLVAEERILGNLPATLQVAFT